MERLTMFSAMGGYQEYDPIDIVENDYSIANFKKLVDKLGEYEDLEEQGLLLRLPCKVGDVMWLVFTPKYPANPSDKGKWFMKQDGVQRLLYGAKGFSIETWNLGTIPAKEIGKTVFLTKEEAEAKLKELEGSEEE